MTRIVCTIFSLLDNLARPNITNEYALPASTARNTFLCFIISFILFTGDVIDSCLCALAECNVASVSNRCQIKMNYALLKSTVAKCFCFRSVSRRAIHITITVAHWQEGRGSTRWPQRGAQQWSWASECGQFAASCRTNCLPIVSLDHSRATSAVCQTGDSNAN